MQAKNSSVVRLALQSRVTFFLPRADSGGEISKNKAIQQASAAAIAAMTMWKNAIVCRFE
jgi:hypothetical protein